MDHNMNILTTCNLFKEIILNAHDVFPNPLMSHDRKMWQAYSLNDSNCEVFSITEIGGNLNN